MVSLSAGPIIVVHRSAHGEAGELVAVVEQLVEGGPEVAVLHHDRCCRI